MSFPLETTRGKTGQEAEIDHGLEPIADSDHIAPLSKIPHERIPNRPRGKASVIIEAPVLMTDYRRRQERADIRERNPMRGPRPGTHLEDGFVGLDRAVAKRLLEALYANPPRRALELTEIADANRKLGGLEIP